MAWPSALVLTLNSTRNGKKVFCFVILFYVFVLRILHLYNRLLYFPQWDFFPAGNSGRFTRGKSAAIQSRYPAYLSLTLVTFYIQKFVRTRFINPSRKIRVQLPGSGYIRRKSNSTQSYQCMRCSSDEKKVTAGPMNKLGQANTCFQSQGHELKKMAYRCSKFNAYWLFSCRHNSTLKV